MNKESKCEFCEVTLEGLRESNAIEYGELEASAANGCEACGCLLEAMDYYQEEDPNVSGVTLNAFGPLLVEDQPLILSPPTSHGGRQSEKYLCIDVFTVGEVIGEEDIIR
jgi:hypothetical protein